MAFSLDRAQVYSELVLLAVRNPELERRLQRLGLFAGSRLTRLNDDVQYHPVRVRGGKGDVVVPAGLAMRLIVHLDNGERKPLVEMRAGENGHVESATGGRECSRGLDFLGLAEESRVTLVKTLPHMDYVTVIERKERTRLSEGEAARIWGGLSGREPAQFFFADRNRDFVVDEVFGGPRMRDHLCSLGIKPGTTIMLEAIERTRELHTPGSETIILSSPGGLRLYLNQGQAGLILVDIAAEQGIRS